MAELGLTAGAVTAGAPAGGRAALVRVFPGQERVYQVVEGGGVDVAGDDRNQGGVAGGGAGGGAGEPAGLVGVGPGGFGC